ncbi:MAG: DUF4442 domain-containing protein [Bacteroidota bacterium]
MSIYRKIAAIGPHFFSKATLFKYGFNYSPMYRRSTAKIIEVSSDLMTVKIKLPINWKNKNYVNSIFGGSMFSAVDPIPMVQLLNLIGDRYVVWDKSAKISFKKPAKENLFAEFNYSEKELEELKSRVKANSETEILKLTKLTNKDGTAVYCEVEKTIYVADKNHYKSKKQKREQRP